MTMSFDQLRALAVSAGVPQAGTAEINIYGTDDLPKLMAAIALAESSGDPSKHNNNPATKDDSYGLWQINMFNALGPERRRRFNIKSNKELLDPATNARAMKMILDEQGISAWSVTKGGKDSPAGKILAGTPDSYNKEGTVLSPMQGIKASLDSFTATFLKTTLNGGVIAVSIVLLVIAFAILMRAPAGKAALTAVTKGKI